MRHAPTRHRMHGVTRLRNAQGRAWQRQQFERDASMHYTAKPRVRCARGDCTTCAGGAATRAVCPDEFRTTRLRSAVRSQPCTSERMRVRDGACATASVCARVPACARVAATAVAMSVHCAQCTGLWVHVASRISRVASRALRLACCISRSVGAERCNSDTCRTFPGSSRARRTPSPRPSTRAGGFGASNSEAEKRTTPQTGEACGVNVRSTRPGLNR